VTIHTAPDNSSREALQRWADIVILCAKEKEFDALRNILATDETATIQDPELTLEHFIINKGYNYRIFVARLPPPEAGNVVSGIVASKLSIVYGPWLIVSFGIAGTLNPEEVKANHVVYAREVGYGDLRKDAGKDQTIRKDVPKEKTAQRLLRVLDQLRKEGVKAENPFGIHRVLLLSSEAVVKSGKAGLRQLADSAIADAEVVEMEAYGVYLSCNWNLHDDEVGPLAIAIKAISDKANQKKDDSLHSSSTINAAKFVRTLIEHEAFITVAAHKYRPCPTIQKRRQSKYTEAKGDTSKFMEVVRPLLAPMKKIESSTLEVQLAAAHMRAKRPRVFYHWRLTDIGIHWVEFSFLRVFRQLAKHGYPVVCFVTDEIIAMGHQRLKDESELVAARKKVGDMVRSALMRDASEEFIIWLSQVRQDQDGLREFVKNTGFDYEEVREDIVAQRAFSRRGSSQNREFNLWFKWIAWVCRHDGVGIILSRAEAQTYQFLRLFGTFEPVIVPTNVVAGELDKKDDRRLYLDPPNHPLIRKWITSEQNPAILIEFLGHLREDSSPPPPLTGQLSDCDALRYAIKEELKRINVEWFGFAESDDGNHLRV